MKSEHFPFRSFTSHVKVIAVGKKTNAVKPLTRTVVNLAVNTHLMIVNTKFQVEEVKLKDLLKQSQAILLLMDQLLSQTHQTLLAEQIIL